MQDTVNTFTRDCGCSKTTKFDDSENFDGYDSNREEIEIHLCDTHKTELIALEKEQKDLMSKIKSLEQKIKSINFIRNNPT